ncbi:MAG: hypothetical protein ABSG88_16685 [Bradyrhizobium sp.]|jgi:hypothetical protein
MERAVLFVKNTATPIWFPWCPTGFVALQKLTFGAEADFVTNDRHFRGEDAMTARNPNENFMPQTSCEIK